MLVLDLWDFATEKKVRSFGNYFACHNQTTSQGGAAGPIFRAFSARRLGYLFLGLASSA